MEQLIKAQKEYITFLEEEISRTAGYLFVHNMITPEEICKKGEELREEIKKYENKN